MEKIIYRLTASYLVFCINFVTPSAIAESKFQQPSRLDEFIYDPDFKKLEANEKIFLKYQSLVTDESTTGFSSSIARQRIELLKRYLSENPNDVDVHWLIIDDMLRLGETYDISKKSKIQELRQLMESATSYASKCLELREEFTLCEVLWAVAQGKIASIEGVTPSSVSRGRKIFAILKKTVESKFNYYFREGYSVQGLTHFALGILYRVVPDFFIIRWIIGMSGDIDQSINYHEKGLKYWKGQSVLCAEFELAVSRLCKTKADQNSPITQAAFKKLDSITKFDTLDEDLSICISDANRIRKHPTDACAYTRVGQQDLDMDSVKKNMKK